MKQIFTLLFAILLLQSLTGNAQFAPGNPANFGIDGDLYTEERLQGNFSPTGSHDWFKINNGTGIAVFDTVDAAKVKAQLVTGKNYMFAKKMQYGAYTIQGGYLMLDGTYSRDYFGNDTTLDKTIFSTAKTASQNAQSPLDWVTNEKGDVLPSKSDIIDSYIHMRRQGTSVEIGNASPLIVYIGASTLSTLGDHHVDFELFKTSVKYNGGKFSSTSTNINTGGRDPWTLNGDGSVQNFGGMSFSFSFNSSTVTDVSIYIWVNYTTYNTSTPANFAFDKGTEGWNGLQPKGGYGFARIIPKNGGTLPAWGGVNTTAVQAPLWGTTNKDYGAQANNYYHAQYAPGEFAEAAIDLSALGVDPAFSTTFDKCSPPYRRVVIKTRSSSSFSSALQDFAGPFEFLDAPTVPATISFPANLTCTTTNVTLSAVNQIIGANYLWKDELGNVISNGSAAFITVNQPGQYSLTASLYEGCTPSTEKADVFKDVYQPVATASTSGLLTNSPGSYVYLIGGNYESSNYATPFGGSNGLTFSWTGPDGFNSDSRDVKTQTEGEYELIVTENRNGCKDTATLSLARLEATILASTINSLSLHSENNRNNLNWVVSNNGSIKKFEVEKSYDGRSFTTITHMFATDKTGNEQYVFVDKNEASKVYYRIKVTGDENNIYYSKIMMANREIKATQPLVIMNNPVINDLNFNYFSNQSTQITINIYNQFGNKVYTQKVSVGNGNNQLSAATNAMSAKGSYVLEVVANDNERRVTKFIKL